MWQNIQLPHYDKLGRVAKRRHPVAIIALISRPETPPCPGNELLPSINFVSTSGEEQLTVDSCPVRRKFPSRALENTIHALLNIDRMSSTDDFRLLLKGFDDLNDESRVIVENHRWGCAFGTSIASTGADPFQLTVPLARLLPIEPRNRHSRRHDIHVNNGMASRPSSTCSISTWPLAFVCLARRDCLIQALRCVRR
jgi:hypothetical protein